MTLQTALGVIGVISAIGGIIVAIYKLKPESGKVFIESARASAEMADSDRAEARLDAANAKLELAAERLAHSEYRKQAGDHMAEQATMIRGLKAELKHCQKELELERLRGQDEGQP